MNRRISRRAFIAGVATSAVVAAIAVMSPRAGAQQTGALRRVGVLLALLSPDGKEAQAFRQGLAQAGYSEGRDLVIEWRSSQGDYALLPQLAAQLVQRKVDVIVADTTRAVQAAKEITSSVPIVMTLAADPVGSDLVTTLRHPGGNITGLSILLAELSTKRLQLLREAMPQLVRVAVLSNSASPYHRKAVEELRAVAPTMSLELSFLDVLAPEQIESVFAALGKIVQADTDIDKYSPVVANHF